MSKRRIALGGRQGQGDPLAVRPHRCDDPLPTWPGDEHKDPFARAVAAWVALLVTAALIGGTYYLVKWWLE